MRAWEPRYRCYCLHCEWTGTRTAKCDKPCPRCGREAMTKKWQRPVNMKTTLRPF